MLCFSNVFQGDLDSNFKTTSTTTTISSLTVPYILWTDFPLQCYYGDHFPSFFEAVSIDKCPTGPYVAWVAVTGASGRTDPTSFTPSSVVETSAAPPAGNKVTAAAILGPGVGMPVPDGVTVVPGVPSGTVAVIFR